MTADPQPVSHPPATAAAALALLQTLAHRHRLGVLAALCHRPATSTELCTHLEMQPSALAHHIRQLRQMNLIQRRRTTDGLTYEITDPALTRLIHDIDRIAQRHQHLSHTVRA